MKTKIYEQFLKKLIIFVLLAFSISTLNIKNAQAWGFSWPGRTPTIPTSCFKPSLSLCKTNSYLKSTCTLPGQYRNNERACEPILSEYFKGQLTNKPTEETINPFTNRKVNAVIGDSIISKRFAYGLNSTIFGDTLKIEADAYSDQNGLDFVFTDKKQSWVANGQQLDSCDEYVYYSHEVFALWERQMAKHAGNFRKILDESFYNNWWYTIAIWDYFENKIEWPKYNVPKNIFATVLSTSWIHDPAIHTSSILKNDLSNQISHHKENMSWHLEANEYLSSRYLDEELVKVDKLKYDFAAILNDRENEIKNFLKAARDKMSINKSSLDKFLQHDHGLLGGHYYVAATFDSNTGGYDRLYLFAPDFSNTVSFSIKDLARLSLLETEEELKEFFDKFIINFNKYNGQIKQALYSARAKGCLNDSAQFNKCDWSPKFFVQRLVDIKTVKREALYNKCLDYATEGLGNLKNYEFKVNGSYMRDANNRLCRPMDYTSSKENMDLFFERVEFWYTKLSDEVEKVGNEFDVSAGVDERNAESKIIKKKIDDEFDFGVEDYRIYGSYNAKWEFETSTPFVTETEQKICYVRPSIYADLQGSAVIFGKDVGHDTYGVIFGKFSADPGKIHSELFINGEKVDMPSQELQMGNDLEAVNNMTTDLREKDGEPEDKIEEKFSILGIDILIGAEVYYKVGFDYLNRLEYNLDLDKACTANDNSTRISHKIQLTPKADIDFKGSAAIELSILKAGIKGTIKLLAVKLPFNSNFEISNDRLQGLNITANTSLKMNIRALDGKTQYFVSADIPFLGEKSKQGDLFDWTGPSKDFTYFDKKFDVNLNFLTEQVKVNKN